MRPLLLISLLLFAGALHAQKGKLAKADRLFDRYAFTEAAELYEKILQKEDDSKAQLRLAECYRLTNQFEKAAEWYGKAVGGRGIDPVYKFRYGQMLLSSGTCVEAEYWFREYARLRPEDGRGERFEEACQELAGLYQDDGRYTVEALDINTEYADFAPAFYEDGLVFLSARPDGRGGGKVHAWTGEPFLDYYFSAPTDGGFRDVEHFGGNSLNSKHHEGPLTFSADGQTVFFTRNNAVSESVKENSARTVRLKIFTASRSGDKRWSRIKELDFNSGDFSTAAPTLSKDEDVLIFSSTRPGGFGGADLYMSRWQNEEWTRPVNLGSGINTEGEEVFPFLHLDGTLYFSSDGHAGLGGLDLFAAEADFSREQDVTAAAGKTSAKPSDSTKQNLGVWLPARNMGWALNSRWDDFGLVWDEEREAGYFASNRPEGAGGDDIYFMRHNWVRVDGLVVDSLTGEALPYADVKVAGAPGDKMVRANDIGRFSIDLPRAKALSFTGFFDGYDEGTTELETPTAGIPNHVRVPLTPAGIPVRVRVVDSKTMEPLPAARLKLDNGCSDTRSNYIGDSQGSVEMTLSRGCDYVWLAGTEGYADGVLPVSREALRSLPEATFTLALDPLAAGLTIELKNVYYDFDKSYIREDGVEDLIALTELLQANPAVRIELGSHTDARGGDDYNRELSQRRAEAAVAYLIKLGINPGRVEARGYGEDRLRNSCGNGVNCSDEEHQRNRRTEFRVLGLDAPLESSDKKNIPVNTGRKAR